MQEQVEDRTVNLAVSTTKLTGQIMWSAFKAFHNHVKAKALESMKALEEKSALKEADAKICGRQPLKELIAQNQGVSALEVGDGTFKDFLRCADKVGVDYAITVDKSLKPKRYTVFFKARDADALTQIMKMYAEKTMNRQKRPSVIKLLNKMKEKAASTPRRQKHRNRERVKSR